MSQLTPKQQLKALRNELDQAKTSLSPIKIKKHVEQASELSFALFETLNEKLEALEGAVNGNY